MPSAHEHFSAQFEKWEMRGRGWRLFPQPISPEPPFVPFRFRPMAETPAIDDGRRPTFLSSLARKWARPAPAPPPLPIEPEEEEPEPTPLSRESLVEFQASLPDKLDVSQEAFEQFLLNLSLCREPIAFELIGSYKKVAAQFAAASSDAPLVRRQLQAFFPEAVFVPVENDLESAWNATTGDEMLAVEFGLEREFMLPLASGKLDPFIGIIGALAELLPGELGLFQVLWQPVRERWAESILESVMDRDGKPFFVDHPELTSAAENKVARPLFAAVVRIMVCAGDFDRILQLATDLAGSLRVFSNPNGNALIPLHNEEYPLADHLEDVLRRQTRRTGMLLNSDELTGFVHIPSSAVRSPIFARQTTKTKAAPGTVRLNSGLLLGENEHAGQTVEVRLSPEQRVHHCHIIGATGTGKSTLLFNLIRQDIENGEGVAVLDPNGDLIDGILGIIPRERIDDVILVNPVDESHAIGFNILSAHSGLEKNLLASDLVAMFQRLSTTWGDQMNSILQNAILAFLESDRGGTIADLLRFLTNESYQKEFLTTVKDSRIVDYWQETFPGLGGKRSIGSILTRLDTFLAQKPIRYMVSQPENRLDFAQIMDNGKILLARLPEGLLGRENSHLLGTLLVSKFQQIIMSRQAQMVAARRDFWIYIDEFANFITPTMAEILSGARKYRIGLTLAHHELHQLQRIPEVASAVLTHPYTRIFFRVGDDDAKKLGESLSSFEAKDLRNLKIGQAICRVERSDFDFNLSVPLPVLPDADAMEARRQEVITSSRKNYGTERADVEAMLAKSRTPPSDAQSPASPPAKSERKRPEVVPPIPSASVVPQPVEMPVASESPPVAKVPKPATKAETPQAPRDFGRGGAQHQAIQKRIKAAAEALGFRGIIEKPVLDGQGSVDLWLERADQTIACEISISTTVDHEVGNVRKCLAAGLPQVAIICVSEDRLHKIATAVSGSLGAEAAAKVSYFQPDPFIAHLKTLPPPQEAPVTKRGYIVKRSIPALTDEEQRQRGEIANQRMAEAIQQKIKNPSMKKRMPGVCQSNRTI
ncbi:MAG: type IV secretion system DNA-binding domain-containing protein [Candidatus Pacebacteria bacterium]|nr:type IV secretion system DNA-binding domain-containing protein [Candidatus Paceibacterota bacterium]